MSYPKTFKIQYNSEQIRHILLLGSGTPTQYPPPCGGPCGRLALPGRCPDAHAVHAYHGAIPCRPGTIRGRTILCRHRTIPDDFRLDKPLSFWRSQRSNIWPLLP